MLLYGPTPVHPILWPLDTTGPPYWNVHAVSRAMVESASRGHKDGDIAGYTRAKLALLSAMVLPWHCPKS